MALFPNMPQAIAALRQDRLVRVARTYFPGVELSDDYVAGKLRSAEASMQRALRVLFTPTEILPPGTTTEERTALATAGTPTLDEPGYDYDPAMFQGNTWGMVQLRQRHAISVSRMWFAYPAITTDVWTIPTGWIRLDKKPGILNLVPGDGLMAVPLNSYILSALGGGRTVPLMLQIRYRAGLENVEENWPDLIDLVKKAAVLDIVNDSFLPTSGSISADGLSRSLSYDAEKLGETIEAKTERLRQAIQGIRLMVL